jgi:hypothetical protein
VEIEQHDLGDHLGGGDPSAVAAWPVISQEISKVSTVPVIRQLIAWAMLRLRDSAIRRRSPAKGRCPPTNYDKAIAAFLAACRVTILSDCLNLLL